MKFIISPSFIFTQNQLLYRFFWGSLPQLQNTYFAEHISVVAPETKWWKLWIFPVFEPKTIFSDDSKIAA